MSSTQNVLHYFVTFFIVLWEVLNTTLKTSKGTRSINFWIVIFVWAKFIIYYQVFCYSFSSFLFIFCCTFDYFISNSFFSSRRVIYNVFRFVLISSFFSFIFINSFFSLFLPSCSSLRIANATSVGARKAVWAKNTKELVTF